MTCARPRRTRTTIYLAADPDREGEAICAHLEEILTASQKTIADDVRHGMNGRKTPKKKRAKLLKKMLRSRSRPSRFPAISAKRSSV